MKMLLSKNYRCTCRLFLALTICALLIPLSACDQISNLTNKDTRTEDPRPLLNVLFIGNSYTYFNDMPLMLEGIINQNPDSPVRVHIEQVVAGAAFFETHWNTGTALQTIQNGTQWHYVILQNQSDWAMHPDKVKNAYIYAPMFATEITKVGAVPVLFVTWPKEPGAPQYQQMPLLRDFSHSYHTINRQSKALAKTINAQIVPVNDYWIATMQKTNGLKMYTDGSHPTPEASYLIALIFYKLLTGENFQNKDIRLQGIDPDVLEALEYIASTPPDVKQ